MKNKTNKTTLIGGALLFILVLVLVMYFIGYRMVEGFRIGKIGYVEMIIPMPQTSIYLDQSQRIITTKDNEKIKLPFSPKNHNVIISKEGYYPWKKEFKVVSNQSLFISPIFVSQNPSGIIINKNDPEYNKIISKINNNSLTNSIEPKLSIDGLVLIWGEEGAIMSKKGDEIIKVIAPETEVKNIEFYKDHSDAIIFSTSNTIYMIEIDVEGQQNFMPIYKGTNPYFVKTDPNYIYVLDSGTLMQIII